MRPVIAAVVGALAGAVAATIVATVRPSPPGAPDEATSRALATLTGRLERLERVAARPPRAAPAPEPPATSAPPAGREVPEWGDRGGRHAPPTAEPDVDLSKMASADLALEGDERWARDEDVAGAAKRYRELLSRGGSPSERRHWFIRLGDCFVRMKRYEEGLRSYRDCVDASTEDHVERVACMLELARHERATDVHEAMRWIDAALALSPTRYDSEIHALAADVARETKQTDREIREITWLIDHRCAPVDGWTDRLAQARGEKR